MNTPILNTHGERIDYAFQEVPSSCSKAYWIVLLGHGVTGNKDRPIIVETAKALNAAGFDTLRFSYAGNGDSEGDFRDATISKEADDLDAVITAASAQYANIAYIGHSMGGAVGLLQASRDPRIKALVSIAGMVDTQAFAKEEFGALTPDKDVMWEEPDFPLSSAYMTDLCETHKDLKDRISSVKAPWLLVHGDEDDIVLPKDSETVISLKPTDTTLEIIKGANHVFDDPAKMSLLTQKISSWLSTQ